MVSTLPAPNADIITIDVCADVRSTDYPGWSPGDLAQTVKLVAGLGRRIVAQRGDVRYAAAAVAWLVSDAAKFITGTAWPLDAGLTIR